MESLSRLFSGKAASNAGVAGPGPSVLGPSSGDARQSPDQGLLGALGNDSAMLQHAQKLWQHLDELAANDPEGYRKFLDQQAKAAGVQQPTSGGAGKAAVIVTCGVVEGPNAGSSAVLEIWPDTQGEVKPATIGGAPYRGQADNLRSLHLPLKALRDPEVRSHGALGPGGRGLVLACKAHPDVVRLAVEEAEARAAVVEWASKFWEIRAQVKLSRESRKVFLDRDFLSPATREGLREEERRAREAGVRRVAEEAGTHLPQDLVSELAALSMGGGAGARPTQARREPLVQELGEASSSSHPAPSPASQKAPHSALKAPSWVREKLVTKGYCQVLFSLPGVQRAAEVDLEVFEGQYLWMDASRRGFRPVEVWLGCVVDETAIRAKFSRKRRQLLVILPFLSKSNGVGGRT